MKNRVKIFHVRDDKRDMTIVTEVSEDLKKVTLGFAFCSDKDNFSKKKGREVGEWRIIHEPVLVDDFSGHSADSIMRLFNHPSNIIRKPKKWQHGQLLNLRDLGLTFVEEV